MISQSWKLIDFQQGTGNWECTYLVTDFDWPASFESLLTTFEASTFFVATRSLDWTIVPIFLNIFCWHAPFVYYIFLYFQMNQNWVQKSILLWLTPFPSSIMWRDSNPQPYDRESNSLATRPDWHPTIVCNLSLFKSLKRIL